MPSPRFLAIIPKLPAKDLAVTKSFYEKLNFQQVGGTYPDYLMMCRDEIEIHFFLYEELNAPENYGMCYLRITGIDAFYSDLQKIENEFSCLGKLEVKPWKQKEFSITDDDNNQLTFGEETI